MNAHLKETTETAASPSLLKADANTPVFKTTGRATVVIKAGTIFGAHTFDADTPVPLHLDANGEPGYIPGADYTVTVRDGVVAIAREPGIADGGAVLGGFHFAPGGNASARAGGDDIPAINPFSLWDVNFRPACKDPRGMTLIERPDARFWCDIYLTGVDAQANGTSRLGVAIADGEDRPRDPDGKKYKCFDYETACAVIAAHGKTLLSIEEFFAAAYGVTEKSSASGDPEITGLDAPRTSRFGIMQATGNLWVWGHDGDPGQPRASIFGGSWVFGDHAGSRYASVGHWPGNSVDVLGARGRSDHLQLG